MPKHKGKGRIKQSTPYNRETRAGDDDTSRVSENDQEPDPSLECDKCKGLVNELIQCELCSVWFCCTCGNFSSQVVEAISTCKTLHWFCEPCDNVLNFPNFDPSIYKESIDNRLKSIESKLTKVSEQIKTWSSEALQIDETVSMESTSAAEEAEPSSLECRAPGLLSISNTVISALNENKEKERRRLNIILHQLPESIAENSQTRKNDDISEASKIFNKVLSIPSNVTNAIRLGQKSAKPRLLKITLDSERSKALILKNCTKLRGTDTPEYLKSVFITPDLTPKERDTNKALRSKLNELNKDGKVFRIKTGR